MTTIIGDAIDSNTRIYSKSSVDSMERGLLRLLVSPDVIDHDLADAISSISGDELARVRAES